MALYVSQWLPRGIYEHNGFWAVYTAKKTLEHALRVGLSGEIP